MNLFTQDRPRVLDKRSNFESQIAIINDTFAAIWRKIEELKKSQAVTNTNRAITNTINQALSSINVSSLITGTPNQVNVIDNGDGTVTLSAPQDINATANPQFNDVNVTGQIKSTVAPGTPPIVTTSTAESTNLNSELIDGHHITVGTVAPPAPLVGDIWVDTN